MAEPPGTVDETLALLAAGDYVGDRGLAVAVYLSLAMGRPLFLEGEAGVGKTEIARVLADRLGRRLVRLQCYEGLDAASAVYEWNYAAQTIEIQAARAAGAADRKRLAADVFDRRFLIARPILQALESGEGGAAVLLIDELDRADEPFEAYLLEVLADFQVTIPEIGPVRAESPPAVVITSNRTREIHDAIKRRCFYHWIDYPDAAREKRILAVRAPGVREELARQVVAFVQKLRGEDLFKNPGVAETIDWANALRRLDRRELDPATVDETLGALLKYRDDLEKVRGARAAALLAENGAGTARRSDGARP